MGDGTEEFEKLSLSVEEEEKKAYLMMSIYLSRSFPRSNSSFFLCSGNALQSEVWRLKEEIFLVDAGPGHNLYARWAYRSANQPSHQVWE